MGAGQRARPLPINDGDGFLDLMVTNYVDLDLSTFPRLAAP